ncbi:hypothetical protein LTR43_008409 [Exophiala xenobiotica]|nr:hypothetical protein LTR14_006619 [Exophiala xenobiotica]
MLYRMNKILEVNEKLAYIAVEPGVTFFDIYNHVRDNNLGVWPSVPGLGWGSVVGNTLDRGFGYTSHGDHHNFICGLEVVLANGDIVRTGQWAIEESKAGPACKMSFGPQIEGLFVQSNLGIVTKMALWVQPQPQVCMSVQVHGEEAEDIVPLIDVLGKLYQEGVLQNDPNIVNVFNYAALQTRRAKYHEGEGPLTYEETKRLQKDLGGGYWLCSLHFYGNKGMVTARFQALKEVFDKTCPQARIESDWYEGADQKLLDAEAVKSRPLGAGVPSMDRVKTFSFNLPLGSANFGAHTDVSPILPRNGKSVWAWFQEALKIVNSYGYDLIVGGHLFQKHVVFVHPYIFNRDDPSNLEIAHKMTTELLAKSKELKHPSYRAHLMWMDEIQEHYDFNNHAYRRFVEELKKTLDPKGILAPGKQGIWPRNGITQ